jgi:hypothetical protein
LQQTKGADMPEVAPTREQVEEVVEMVPAAALAEARADCEAMGTVLDLLHERLPDAQCMGDLPGCVDELRAEVERLRQQVHSSAAMHLCAGSSPR